MKSISRHHSQLQRGLSMIELMIAMSISLVIMLGVSQIFMGSKLSYNLQYGISRMQENGRFALESLSRSIGQAGYTSSLTDISAFNTGNTVDNSTANSALGFTVNDGNASDSIDLKYTSDTDCLGNATGGEANDRYYLSGTNFMCLGNGSNTAGVVAEGVENLQFLYGEDTDANGIANRYTTATNVVDWDAVISVRVALLVDSINAIGPTDDSRTYALLNAPPLGPFNDKLLRRVFTRTIFLRN